MASCNMWLFAPYVDIRDQSPDHRNSQDRVQYTGKACPSEALR